MQFSTVKLLLGFALVALSFFSASTVSYAQFAPSDAQAYSFNGERDFEVEIFPGEPPRVSVYALIDMPVALYVVYSANRFDYAVLGAFQCNKEFTLLKSHTNGLYDIRCTDADVFDESKSYIITYDGSSYVQDFSNPQ